MLDFLNIATSSTKRGVIEISPKFKMIRSEDLMIKGGDFYAIWVEERGLWSTDENDATQLIDRELDIYAQEHMQAFDGKVSILYMWDASSGSIDSWHKYCQKQLRDNFVPLDENVVFSNSGTDKKLYASRRLTYPLEKGSTSAYDKLIGTLYSPAERHKIEWAIGAIVTGDSKTLQKFMVLYGAAGTGKSTVLNIIQKLFKGYYCVFEAKVLGASRESFALEAFRNNPLVAIQHDGDLSHIEDNTRLNSLVSHEEMLLNVKNKSAYPAVFHCFLFMGTNKPVKITDGKSGLLRRLIDVTPSGKKVSQAEYTRLTKKIDFELGAIAWHCKEVYEKDPRAYDNYIPLSMMDMTNDFFNFVEENYHIFKRDNETTRDIAWKMYDEYCNEARVPYPYNKRTFTEELKNYFWEYDSKTRRYTGFKSYIFNKYEKDASIIEDEGPPKPEWLAFEDYESALDKALRNYPAQYASQEGTPCKAWSNVKTVLTDLDTSKLHYVNPPEESGHIFIDFDLKNEKGEKDFALNVAAAKEWPATYAELSKSGGGIHLHYIYTGGNQADLADVISPGIEIKKSTGNSAFRRKLSKCNGLDIFTISSGLPLKKGGKKVVNTAVMQTEKGIRTTINKAIRKEVHASTKSNVDWIVEILDRAYKSGISYDVTDLRPRIQAFAMNSTNNADYCLNQISKMKFMSDDRSEPVEPQEEKPLIFFDIEVFPNLFLINWKYADEIEEVLDPETGKEKIVVKQKRAVVRMINPKPTEIEEFINLGRLVGFNNRDYDNHMIWACMMGYTNEQLYKLSKKIISTKKGEKDNGRFGEAYNLSYTDVYDFAAKKQGLKKWEIELGIHHDELGLPWDEPVPEEMWPRVAEYCDNDVISTEKVFNKLIGDFDGRLILSVLGLGTPNDTTNTLTTRTILGKEKHPKLIWTDLATGKQKMCLWQGRDADGVDIYEFAEVPNLRTDIIQAFPGYERVYSQDDRKYHNMYRGTDVGYGGYIVSYGGLYTWVALLDVSSLHPHSANAMNYFGEATKRFEALVKARVAIKHKDLELARSILHEAFPDLTNLLDQYLADQSKADALAFALKIAINSVYGLTVASFSNPMKHPLNVNNIVALRGALFMRTLQDEVQNRGFKIVAIKTDSIKIANATKDIINFCMEFAKKYGYTFEHEATYERIIQINDADYIAKYASNDWCQDHYGYLPGDNKKHGSEKGGWTATGKQFAIPYIFKTLFSHEGLTFDDFCETFSVKEGALYLDMNEGLPDVSDLEKEFKKNEEKYKKGLLSDTTFEKLQADLRERIDAGHEYKFVGRVGQFCPMKFGCNSGILYRVKDGKPSAAQGTTGYRWLESEFVAKNELEDMIDISYYEGLADKMRKAIEEYDSFDRFVSDELYPYAPPVNSDFMNIPEDVDEDEGLPFN